MKYVTPQNGPENEGSVTPSDRVPKPGEGLSKEALNEEIDAAIHRGMNYDFGLRTEGAILAERIARRVDAEVRRLTQGSHWPAFAYLYGTRDYALARARELATEKNQKTYLYRAWMNGRRWWVVSWDRKDRDTAPDDVMRTELLAEGYRDGWIQGAAVAARQVLAEADRRIVAQSSCGSSFPTPHDGCFVADSLGIVRSVLADLGIEGR